MSRSNPGANCIPLCVGRALKMLPAGNGKFCRRRAPVATRGRRVFHESIQAVVRRSDTGAMSDDASDQKHNRPQGRVSFMNARCRRQRNRHSPVPKVDRPRLPQQLWRPPRQERPRNVVVPGYRPRCGCCHSVRWEVPRWQICSRRRQTKWWRTGPAWPGNVAAIPYTLVFEKLRELVKRLSHFGRTDTIGAR